jgi:NAD-dependent dihydropyrimidine dehydrogenase PreA subunit
MVYVISEACIDVTDRSCVDECPVDCVYEGRRKLYIHPEECIDCGLCVDACPVQAIFPAEEVPDKWKQFINKNYEHFSLQAP